MVLLPLFLLAIRAFAISIPSKNIVVVAKSCKYMEIKWNRGDGQLCLVTCSKSWQKTGYPTDGGSFTPNSYFGQGADVGNENYVVFSGIDSTANIYGLEEDSAYTVRIFEFDYNPFVYYTSNFPSVTDSTETLKIVNSSHAVLDSCRYRNRVKFDIATRSDFSILHYNLILSDTNIEFNGSTIEHINHSGTVKYKIQIEPDHECKNQFVSDTFYIIPGSQSASFKAVSPGCLLDENLYDADVENDKITKSSFTRKWIFDNGDSYTTKSVLRYFNDTLPQQTTLVMYTFLNGKFTGCSDTFGWTYKLNPSPVFELGNDTCLVSGNLLKLTAPIVGSKYIWNGNQSNATYYAKDTGFTTLKIINNFGCSYSDSVHIAYCPSGSANFMVLPNLIRCYIGTNNTIIAENHSSLIEDLIIEWPNGAQLYQSKLLPGKTEISLNCQGLIYLRTKSGWVQRLLLP